MRTQGSQRPTGTYSATTYGQYIKTIKSHAGSTQAMPDGRVLLTLDDGRSFVIDAERLNPQSDGTYQVELIAADHRLHARGAMSGRPSTRGS